MKTFLYIGCSPKRKAQTNAGFAVVTCPDLQAVLALVSKDKLREPAYTSHAGPIWPLDILYGQHTPLVRGNLFMAHRCGFTEKGLSGTLQASGF